MKRINTTPKTHAEALAWWAALGPKPIRWPARHWDKAALDRLLEDLKNDE